MKLAEASEKTEVRLFVDIGMHWNLGILMALRSWRDWTAMAKE
jgi:hypothetical protein